ncbi:MAG: nicotinate (nicotinamide) nucleotide adenylyltransferase [Brachymonas sp.]|nr:nicotinate (nicotinamide) nucleotide adenylyltransferase [Brachymonas sp.]
MKSQAKHRVGLYGGAFDPPHFAHMALARAAVEQLGLDVLYIIPTGQPWMKQRRLMPAAHRLAMAQLAFAGLPCVQVDDCELRRSGITYTIDTLRELQARPAHAGQPTDWFLIMGEDLLHTLPQWQRAEDLLREVTAAVLPRTTESGQEQAGCCGTSQAGSDLHMDVAASAATCAAASPQPQQTLHAPAGVRAVPLHLPASTAQAVSGISATRIRNGLQARAALAPQERLAWLQSLVPPAVAQYIEAHQLYSTPQAPTSHAH